MYKAEIKGVYRWRMRINLLLFWITGPWRSRPFSFERVVADPHVSWRWDPVKDVPLQAAAHVDLSAAEFSLLFMGQEVFEHRVIFPPATIEARPFNWEPVKGVKFEGAASFRKLEAPVLG